MILYGDINRDGKIDDQDYKLAMRLAYFTEDQDEFGIPKIPFTPENIRRADVDGDGLVTFRDVQMISAQVNYEHPINVELRRKLGINTHTVLMEMNTIRNFDEGEIARKYGPIHFGIMALYPLIAQFDDNTDEKYIPQRTFAEIYDTPTTSSAEQIQQAIDTFQRVAPNDPLPQDLVTLQNLYPVGTPNTVTVNIDGTPKDIDQQIPTDENIEPEIEVFENIPETLMPEIIYDEIENFEEEKYSIEPEILIPETVPPVIVQPNFPIDVLIPEVAPIEQPNLIIPQFPIVDDPIVYDPNIPTVPVDDPEITAPTTPTNTAPQTPAQPKDNTPTQPPTVIESNKNNLLYLGLGLAALLFLTKD
jgi:hypothetical protein